VFIATGFEYGLYEKSVVIEKLPELQSIVEARTNKNKTERLFFIFPKKNN